MTDDESSEEEELVHHRYQNHQYHHQNHQYHHQNHQYHHQNHHHHQMSEKESSAMPIWSGEYSSLLFPRPLHIRVNQMVTSPVAKKYPVSSKRVYSDDDQRVSDFLNSSSQLNESTFFFPTPREPSVKLIKKVARIITDTVSWEEEGDIEQSVKKSKEDQIQSHQ